MTRFTVDDNKVTPPSDQQAPPPVDTQESGGWRTIYLGFLNADICLATKAVRDLIGVNADQLIDITTEEEQTTVVREVHKMFKPLVKLLKETGKPILFLGPRDHELLGLKPSERNQIRVRVSQEVCECP